MNDKPFEIFLVFLRLGCTSFGGPIAHLGYFHEEFVVKRKWFDEHAYVDIVALCQFLPGPASSQVGIAVGLSRAGISGAVAAWLGFTLPSTVIMIAVALGFSAYGNFVGQGLLHGLKIVAVAVVAQAIWGMGTKLCPDLRRASIAAVAALGAATLPFAWAQLAVLALGGLAGVCVIRDHGELPRAPIGVKLGTTVAASSLATFLCLLIVLPLLAKYTEHQSLKLFDGFFRAGSFVFGGGHVVLPLLKTEVVDPGWISADAFMAGYGVTQAIPGPLFTFTAYLGATSRVEPNGIPGALICLVGAFLPSFLLVFGALPFWDRLRRIDTLRFAMLGINAAVVGLLVAAFYDPVWTSAIGGPRDYLLAAVYFVALSLMWVPSWAVVALGCLVSAAL